MRYLLDTNVCVDYVTGHHPEVVRRIQSSSPEDMAVSAIAVAELRYGADKSARPRANHELLDAFLADVPAVDFNLRAASEYGRLRAALERAGTPIGPNDMLIAAQALAIGAVVVTDNDSEFKRVGGLQVENWRGGPAKGQEP